MELACLIIYDLRNISMKKFEYKQLCSSTLEELMEQLKILGIEGWELSYVNKIDTNVYSSFYIIQEHFLSVLKREIT